MGPGQGVAAGLESLQDLFALVFWCSKNVFGDRICADMPQPARNSDCWEMWCRGTGIGECVSAKFCTPVKVLLVKN